MLACSATESRAALMDAIVPAAIRRATRLALPAALTEAEALARIRGDRREEQGAEIVHRPGLLRHAHARRDPAQRARESPRGTRPTRRTSRRSREGRLEALVNFQTMVCDLTGHGDRQRVDAGRGDRRGRGDDAVPARVTRSATRFVVADDVLPQTIDVVRTRARAARHRGRHRPARPMRQTPTPSRSCCSTRARTATMRDYRALAAARARARRHVVVAARPAARSRCSTPPGEWGADVVVGSRAALRRADGLRRPARRLPRDARRVQALRCRAASSA